MIILFLLAPLGYFFMRQNMNEISKPEVTKINEPEWFYKLDSEFKKAEMIHGVDWKLLKAIGLTESALGQNSLVKAGKVSYDGLSWGLMQFTMTTARDFDSQVTVEKLKDDKYSINLVGKYFAMLKKLFPDSLNQTRNIVMSYNHGQGNQKRFVELEKSGKLKVTDFPQGRDYWNKFQKNYKRVLEGEK